MILVMIGCLRYFELYYSQILSFKMPKIIKFSLAFHTSKINVRKIKICITESPAFLIIFPSINSNCFQVEVQTASKSLQVYNLLFSNTLFTFILNSSKSLLNYIKVYEFWFTAFNHFYL